MMTELDMASVTYVCLGLRPADQQEIYGLLPHNSPILLALQIMQTFGTNGRARVVWHDGKPSAIVGLAEYRPGVWQVALMGTDDFKQCAKDCLRWLRDTLPEVIEKFGGRRLQCDSHEDHHEAHRFLRTLGARPEGPPMLGYGKDQKAYQRFVWFAQEGSKLLREKAA